LLKIAMAYNLQQMKFFLSLETGIIAACFKKLGTVFGDRLRLKIKYVM
jgi:hypothetical protein